MFGSMKDDLKRLLADLEEQGLYKHERILTSPQGSSIAVASPTGEAAQVVNFCANNYLGLANHPELRKAACEAVERWGFGYASVRFICGTTALHRELEAAMSAFLGTEDTILYAAAFDANGGVFEPLLGEQDAIISDALNHASIIDGVRLCKAARYRYRHSDMEDLRTQLAAAVEAGSRYRIIATDGVFSMDGDIARLPEIVALAEQFDALVMVDDCHATGYLGAGGRGTAEYFGLEGAIDIITTTFGKALGGASGGCVSGRGEIIELLRQRSRPYLFSNTLAPAIVGATLRALKLVDEDRSRLRLPLEHAARFSHLLREAGLDVLPTETAIVPVMIYDESKALEMAQRLLERGLYVIGFAYPVVPRGKARIRVQMSAAHTAEEVDRAVDAFVGVAREMEVIP
ncbi:MAG: glycine C-acetyltransferase [Spirochaetales bacterium]|nr:glycine C-acetyltransferase [Spirochaetales bacterium]